MRLFEGTTQQFYLDVTQNQIADKLSLSFENYYGRKVNPSEKNSWENSLPYLAHLISDNSLLDNMITLEYEPPYCMKRIDAILFGKDYKKNENVVVIELKQWANSSVEDSEIEGNVITIFDQTHQEVAHPSLQVKGYHFLLKDFMRIFGDEKADLNSCVFCHNYSKNGNPVLFKEKFKEIIQEYPVFAKDDFEKFGNYLKEKLGNGEGLEIFNRFINSPIEPSKKLLEHTKKMIDRQQTFTLIDEQIVAYNTILDRAKKASKLKNKSVIIIRGGPGTGKSVIALKVLAELASMNQKVFHVTNSKPFTTTLKNIVDIRASTLFKRCSALAEKRVRENELDVLICDEAHRIKKSSNDRFTPKTLKSEISQTEELIRVAKVSIFFIDDFQVIRPDEIGSTDLIKKTASQFKADIHDFELKTQFRCSGSDGYLNWIDDLLQIRETANHTLTKNEKMEFKIFDSPHKLYEAIKEKNKEKPNSARMVAGFCWPWSDPNPDGSLVEDVVIGDFKLPWEGKEGKKLASGIPPWYQWAYDPNGVHQCGCIYTIQGFEFDYVGIIFGQDLLYDSINKKWIGNKKNSCDPVVKRAKDEDFLKYIKSIYRVYLTRGMKGCYVYFVDKDTEKFFKSRIEE